ncbi:hypothetical protein [Streptomyces sp. ADI98-10]|uniref:hypothetical protein n=1 Tax=Streptomyces sp. ADI98-10 TaxID=1522763 RepID=UPI000F550641|nr:hypothetical protein [Streptomyces sp. ADI98-10]
MPRTEPPPPVPDVPDVPDVLSAEVAQPGPEPEWWRKPPPEDPVDVSEDPAPLGREGAPATSDAEHWPGAGIEAGHGMEGIVAAHEIGAHIGEAISSHLPGAQGESRKLDLRWLLLRYNVPGLAVALLVTWEGRSSFDRMADLAARDGILAPVGVVLCVVLVGLLLTMLPVGSQLGAAVGHVVSALLAGVVQLVRRAWGVRYVGYLLRVAVAVVVWSVVLAVGRVVWREAVLFLTGA